MPGHRRARQEAKIETELKITLDTAGENQLLRHPSLETLRVAPRSTQNLLSIYHDTEDHALAAAGISLRLRKIGRRWVQTIKQARSEGAGDGLFANHEVEFPAPGGRLILAGSDAVFEALAAARGEAPLAPVFETRVRRTVEHLRAPAGGEVELAIDRGEIVAGHRREPILEAELELLSGDVDTLYELAAELFSQGPIQFGTANKAARGYALLREEAVDQAPRPRMAGRLAYGPDASVETVVRDILRDCFAQISRNMLVVARTEMEEGPHQLRVGLRRLRTALGIFAPSFGGTTTLPLNEEARRLGQVVSGLRDLDVLIEDVGRIAALGLDDAARDALVAALRDLREEKRTQVRQELAEPAATRFLFDLGRFIEARGWLAPSDYSQTTRLAAPIAEVAPMILAKRHRKARRLGRGIEEMDAESLHTLRKELKKLRYAADMLDPIYHGRKASAYLRSLKDMQDTFGSLTDAAMAEGWLTGPEAPGRSDPDAQRGAGWMLGALAVKVKDDRPRLFERWHLLTKADRFWD